MSRPGCLPPRALSHCRSADGTILPSPGTPEFRAKQPHTHRPTQYLLYLLKTGQFGKSGSDSSEYDDSEDSLLDCVCYWQETLDDPDWSTGPLEDLLDSDPPIHKYKHGNEGVAIGWGPDPTGEAFNPFTKSRSYGVEASQLQDGESVDKSEPVDPVDVPNETKGPLFLSSTVESGWQPESRKRKSSETSLPDQASRKAAKPGAQADQDETANWLEPPLSPLFDC